MIYQLTYELRDANRDYSALFSYIEHNIGDAAIHVLKDSWWIYSKTLLDVDLQCSSIRQQMGEHDYLYMSPLSSDSINGWMPSTVWDWYRNHK